VRGERPLDRVCPRKQVGCGRRRRYVEPSVVSPSPDAVLLADWADSSR
jgi:hypothetical protein